MATSTVAHQVRNDLSVVKSSSMLQLTDLPDDHLLSIFQFLPSKSIISLLQLNSRFQQLGRYALGRRAVLVLNATTITGTNALTLRNLLLRTTSFSLCNLEVNLGLIVLLDGWMPQLSVLQLSNLTFESPSICRALWTQLTTGMPSLKNLQLIDMAEITDVPAKLVPFFTQLDHLTIIGALSTVDRHWLLRQVVASGVFQSLTMDFEPFFWQDVYMPLFSKPLQIQQIRQLTFRGERAIDFITLVHRQCVLLPPKCQVLFGYDQVVVTIL